MYASVVIKSKTRMTDRLYTYLVPSELEDVVVRGMRVLVPFGKGDRPQVAIVVELFADSAEDYQFKEITEVVETQPILSDELVEIALYMKEKCLSDLSSAFQTVMPPGDIVTITELFYPGEGLSAEGELKEALKKGLDFQEILALAPQLSGTELKNLIAGGQLIKRFELNRGASIKVLRLVELILDDPELIRKGATKQLQILDYLREHPLVEMKELLTGAGASLTSVRTLEEKEMIRIYDQPVYRQVLHEDIQEYSKMQLSAGQKAAFDRMNAEEGHRVFLLKGVTGSGKTEVYLHLVSEALRAGKQAIILVPEISLTPQTIARFAGRFGSRVAVLHSKLSLSERFDQWRMVREGEVQIVVGTRSAIFAPFDNLGLIVIDEEHELSYVSDQNPKYDALDIAVFRGKYHDCKVVLGTATPRVETFYQSRLQEVELLELTERVRDLPMPKCQLIDMREELKAGNYSMFSRELRERMEEVLKRKKQIILFLNKRGHTSYVFCRKCGYIHKCEACDVSMTYHKTKHLCICHFCGRTAGKPLICPSCGSNAIKEFGAGTQKLEELTRQEFPSARVVRMDADTMGKKGSYEAVFRQMSAGEIDILIGTQMLTKGFDFPNVLLVGIVAADISLNIPDFRAQEKTFQLLTQVAGRAGRGEEPGHVVIQTYKPEHYAIQSAMEHDYESFFDKELLVRENYKYPPFCDMVLIRVEHPNRHAASKRAFEILRIIGKYTADLDLELIGPNPAVIERIKDRYRFNVIIKTMRCLEELKEILDRHILRNPEIRGQGYRLIVSLNPISLY
ncbi:MAG: primosomal protein N' [Tissierellia bacterium]|nr:primosomal protein N' [Tissierellia bacterium]